MDTALFVWAVMCWALITATAADTYPYLPDWLRTLDPVLGAVVCLSLWWRRRFPLAVSLLAVPLTATAPTSFGAAMVVLLNLGLRVRWPRSGLVLALFIVANVPYLLLWSVPHQGGWVTVSVVLAYHLVFFTWGAAIRPRRQLVLKLREDAARERHLHARKLADAKLLERQAIAREMHDVLAHRISLLSVHAGALAYRTQASAASAAVTRLSDAEIAESAQVIRDNAHLALEELRDVLHVLRTNDETDAAHAADGVGAEGAEHGAASVRGAGGVRPQPTLSDIDGLVAEAAGIGQRVSVTVTLTATNARVNSLAQLGTCELTGLRPQVQRTAYRVLQEGLTNARKHAPHSLVHVTLEGARGEGLRLRITNALPVGLTASGIPGAGAGLVGLRERAKLDGGSLQHGSTRGEFALSAELPWPHDPAAPRR